MNSQTINKRLNKISSLLNNFDEEEQISALEKDLLLSYIRELYTFVLEDIPTATISSPSVKPKPSIQESIPIKTEPKIHTEEAPKMKVFEHQEVEEKQVSAVEHVIEKKVEIKEVPINIPATSQKLSKPELIQEIFAEDTVTDLSDKLGLSAIKDLTKAMGINERIFTQQELFGNDSSRFTQTLSHLDQCQNFNEAKQFLMDTIIPMYDWTHEAKIKKANTFVKMVKRRFL